MQACAAGQRMQNRRGLSRTDGVRPLHVESFNGRIRDELLNETLFRNIAHARDPIAEWVTDYNTERPHSALGYQTPAGFALQLATAITRPAAQHESAARRMIAQHRSKGVNDQQAPVAAG